MPSASLAYNLSNSLIAQCGEAAPELQEHYPGVWRSLVLAERKASKDPSYAPKFRALLQQSLARVKSDRADVLDVDELGSKCREYLLWYDAEARRRGVFETELCRGSLPHQDWLAKWMPHAWARYSKAYGHLVETGKNSAIDTLRIEAQKLLDVYMTEHESSPSR